MKQFLSILKFEFSSYLKNKVFIGMTIALVILMAGFLSYPLVEEMIKGADNDAVDVEERSILVANTGEVETKSLISLFSSAMPNDSFEATDKDVAQMKVAVDNNEYHSAIIIKSATNYTYIVKDVVLYDQTEYIINSTLKESNRISKMAELGLSKEQANEILNMPIESEVIKTGIDQMQNYFYTYILAFAMFMVILLYGQFVAMSVASEKSSRAMEILITSADTKNLMFGKVIGAGLAGLGQLAVWLASAFIFYNINSEYWADNMMIISLFNMPASIILFSLLFFILGFFIYAFLFGAVGSFASKVEDINTSIMPIMIIFLIASMTVISGIMGGNVDSPLMIAFSYIPLTSPLAMFARIAMGDVSTIGIICSVAILLASTICIGIATAKIYRVGVQLYGKSPSIKNIVKALKSK